VPCDTVALMNGTARDGSAIVVRDVHVSRGAAGSVLRGLYLEIARGETLALVGRSGAGKSTLLKLINGLIFPDRGEVLVEGRATREWNPYELRRRIGYVLQEIGLFPHMSVAENIGVVPRLLGWDAPRISARAAEMLALVGLPPQTYAARSPLELSGGQRQRVGIARALALSPKFVLADEIVSGLDVSTQAQILTLLEKLAAEMGLTVAFISHDLSVIRRLCKQVIVMREGVIVEASATDALFENPKQAYTRDLIAAIPLPEIDAGWLDMPSAAKAPT
jgi:ABC-type proline/glycine betaine transport system ATPase subunit